MTALPFPMYMVPGFGELRRCPVALLTAASRRAMALYPHWTAGRLPALVGLPADLVDEMEILQGVIREVEREELEERERQRRQRSR